MGLLKRFQAKLQENRKRRAEALKFQREVAENMKAERKKAYEEEALSVAREQGKVLARRQTQGRKWTIKMPDLWGDMTLGQKKKKETENVKAT